MLTRMKYIVFLAWLICLCGCNRQYEERGIEFSQEEISIPSPEIEKMKETRETSQEKATEERVQEKKNEWYQEVKYPILPGDEEWAQYDYLERLDIINPPKDVISKLSSLELAQLMYSYPFNVRYFEDESWVFSFLELHCDIYKEIVKREDGTSALLELYRNNQICEEDKNNQSRAYVMISDAVCFDVFVIIYMDYHKDNIEQQDIETFNEIFYGEKGAYKDFVNPPLIFMNPIWDEDGNVIK